MRRFEVHGSAGDTLVEVLIVLAILGLSFSISGAIANQSLTQSRNGQEHSEALGMLNTQVELVRSAVLKGASLPLTDPFCMTGPTTTNGAPFSPNFIPPTAEVDSGNKYIEYPDPDCVDGFYHKSIVHISSASEDYYDFRIRWDGLGRLGAQQEEIIYRIRPL